jgi:hypothetical protein
MNDKLEVGQKRAWTYSTVYKEFEILFIGETGAMYKDIATKLETSMSIEYILNNSKVHTEPKPKRKLHVYECDDGDLLFYSKEVDAVSARRLTDDEVKELLEGILK